MLLTPLPPPLQQHHQVAAAVRVTLLLRMRACVLSWPGCWPSRRQGSWGREEEEQAEVVLGQQQG